MSRFSALLPLALIGAIGCVDYTLDEHKDPVDPLDQSDPCIEVDPSEHSFDAIAVGIDDPAELVVTITNSCEGDLELYDVSLNTEGPYLIGQVPTILLGQNGQTEFVVTFAPERAGDFNNRVLITSNDPNTPTAKVKLSGEGIAPVINVTPEDYNYGAPFIGCETAQPYEITNSGNADLHVTDVLANTASNDEFTIDLDTFTNGELPFIVAPLEDGGGGVEIFMEYTALDQFSDTAYLTVGSNDPFTPQKVVGTEGTGTKYGDNLDIFEQPISGASDIAFAFDWSCSMYDDNVLVASQMGVFVATMAGLDADFQLASMVSDDGCIYGSEPYIDNSFDSADAQDAFSVMMNGPSGSNTERLYMVFEAALSNSNIGSSSGCNADWYRDDAFLSLIGVSDEPEQSVNSWSYYISYYQALKSDAEDVIFSAVAGDYPSGCGSAQAGTGYYEGTVSTGGLFLSICATDFGSHLEDIANASVSVNDSFEISQLPVPQTIEVTIDGINMGAGWSYDASSNSVVFQTDYIPAGGSSVEIEYELMPDCES